MIRLYFLFDALHVSVSYVCGYSHRRMIPAYTKCDVQLIKVAPDDGLIESETCRASNRK